MIVETHIYGGLKTWGMILLFGWVLSMLGVIYEWVFHNTKFVSNAVCSELEYITSVVP